MQFNEIIEERFSCRSFEDKTVDKEKIEEILEAVNSAPSAGNLQAYYIFVVSDKTKKSELAEAALKQKSVAEAPVVLVFCADPDKSSQKYGEKGESLYSVQDATIAAVFAWLKAVDLGLAGCWVGGLDEKEVKKVLEIKDSRKPIAILPLGYPKEKKPQRNREELEKRLKLL